MCFGDLCFRVGLTVFKLPVGNLKLKVYGCDLARRAWDYGLSLSQWRVYDPTVKHLRLLVAEPQPLHNCWLLLVSIDWRLYVFSPFRHLRIQPSHLKLCLVTWVETAAQTTSGPNCERSGGCVCLGYERSVLFDVQNAYFEQLFPCLCSFRISELYTLYPGPKPGQHYSMSKKNM